jgi:hypothetical protein
LDTLECIYDDLTYMTQNFTDIDLTIIPSLQSQIVPSVAGLLV